MLATKTPATAKDLVAIGSASGERTVGGAKFSKAWDASWRGHVAAIGAPVVRLAPSGTTGWVIANVALTKKAGTATYTIPFRIFLVFDQGDGGAWTLAHVHFAVAAK
jgi:ketosteroid isomerase-like protein